MTLSKKLRFGEDLQFPIYKKRFRTIMEKDMYIRAVALKIQNDVLREWNPFRGFWDTVGEEKEATL